MFKENERYLKFEIQYQRPIFRPRRGQLAKINEDVTLILCDKLPDKNILAKLAEANSVV